MTRSEYQRYLASREWAVIREAVRRRSRGRCERCRHAPHEETHHLTYERIERELPEDLLGVCGPCHRYLSGKTNHDPCASDSDDGTVRTRDLSRRRAAGRIAEIQGELPVAVGEALLALLEEKRWLRRCLAALAGAPPPGQPNHGDDPISPALVGV